MTTAVYDIDWLLFDIASICEKRYIKATYKPTGEVQEFDTRTQLWGDWRKKNGGWVGDQNKVLGKEVYKAEDFEVVDGQRLHKLTVDGKVREPLVGGKLLIDKKIKEINTQVGATKYLGYTGQGEVFRHEVARMQPYKGNRKDVIKPLLLEKLKQYVIDKHNIILVEGIEADDAYAMAVTQSYTKWSKSKKDKDKVVGIAEDKDTKGVTGFHFNPNKDTEVREISGFGKLWRTEKDDSDGYGRKWFYYQVCYGDDADHYKANAQSKVKWGDKSAHAAIDKCATDKEAWQVLVDTYKKLYPVPVTFKTHTEEEVTMSWLDCLQEMVTLAHMLRKEGDKIVVVDVLNKLGVEYE